MTTARDHVRLPPGLVPRLLTAEQAAAYCGVGRENFEARVGVPPLKVFGNRILYDKVALDRWLDRESGLAEDEAEDRRVDWAQLWSALMWGIEAHRELQDRIVLEAPDRLQ